MTNIQRISFFILIELLLVSCAGRNLARSNEIDISNKNQMYCGIVTSRIVNGPPGYGETPEVDTKREIFVLILDNSYWFSAVDAWDNELIVKEIQLNWDIEKNKDLLKEKVCVQGIIHMRESSFDYLPYVIEVEHVPFIAPNMF